MNLLFALAALDLFVVTDARLREEPSLAAKVRGMVRAGAQLPAWDRRGGFVRTERGWLAKETVALFDDGCESSREMVAVGRFLVSDPSRRALGRAILARGAERLRAEGVPDAASEVLLGETDEALGLPYPEVSFQRALETLEAGPAPDARLLSRTRAGLLRARFPKTSIGLVALWSETAAWLELMEGCDELASLGNAPARLDASALGLGRLLLAAGRPDELTRLAGRVGALAHRDALLAGTERLLTAMRGDGTPPFPQRASWGAGPAPFTVRIEGELGDLALVAGSRRLALPVLPVPGSLRVAPDGRTAAWLEVSTPAKIVPVAVRLDGSLAGDTSLLAGGRPHRDRTRKAHVLSVVGGFSPDGRRLLVSLASWDDAPSPRARHALLDARTGALAWEGPRAREARERLAARR